MNHKRTRAFIELVEKLPHIQEQEVLASMQDDTIGIFLNSSSNSTIDEALLIYKQLTSVNFKIKFFIVFDDESLAPPPDCDVSIIKIQQLLSNTSLLSCVMFLPSATGYISNFYMLFERYGIKTYLLQDSNQAFWKYQFIMEHLTELYDTYSLLNDDFSCSSFLAAIHSCISGQLKDNIYAPEPQYFLSGYLPDDGDIAVDGGGFDGLSALNFSSLGAKVYCFELDKENFELCKSNASNGKFIPVNKGLWSCKGISSYESSNTGSHLGAGYSQCELIDIDTFCLEEQLPTLNYIKLDVEGAELETLKGAFLQIAKYKPKMAISVYHKIDDLFELAKYINSVRNDYTFDFRHYKIDTRNYSLSDYEKERLKKYNLSLQIKTPYEMILYCK